MKRDLTDQDLIAALEWLDSPIGRKFSELEEASSTPEAVGRIGEFVAQMQNSPPSKERIETLQTLDSLIRASETSVEMLLSMQVALAAANACRSSRCRTLVPRPFDRFVGA